MHLAAPMLENLFSLNSKPTNQFSDLELCLSIRCTNYHFSDGSFGGSINLIWAELNKKFSYHLITSRDRRHNGKTILISQKNPGCRFLNLNKAFKIPNMKTLMSIANSNNNSSSNVCCVSEFVVRKRSVN